MRNILLFIINIYLKIKSLNIFGYFYKSTYLILFSKYFYHIYIIYSLNLKKNPEHFYNE